MNDPVRDCDKTVATRAVLYEDLGYYVLADAKKHRLDVTVYPVFEMYDADHKLMKTPTGIPYLVEKNIGGAPVETIEQAEVLLSGAVKWDGCSDWLCNPENIHFCRKEDAVNLGVLLGRLYDLAAELVPAWDGKWTWRDRS